LTDNVQVKLSGCPGFCQEGPIIIVEPEGVFYTRVTADDAIDIVQQHLRDGQFVERLLYHDPSTGQAVPYYRDIPFYIKQQHIILRNSGHINPENIDDYIATGGYEALRKAIFEMTPEQLIDEVKRSGLRGRGGAGFPAGSKWEGCRRNPGTEKFVVCNADEGDPGAFMDRSILESDPHSVIEGMAISGYAIGTPNGYIYVRAEYPLAIRRLRTALRQAEERGFLGNNILGSNFSFNIKVREGAGAFVCGESTALMFSIEGKRGMPRQTPPRSVEAGLWMQPTSLNNVKTFATVPVIITRGAEWYASIGTEGSKGTAVFALTGKITNSGLIEVPMGTTLREIVFDIGGGIPEGKAFKALQTGGPSGGCLPANLLDLGVDFETLTKAGAMMGSGGMVILDEETCMVELARFFLAFTQSESCGKCLPCRVGTRHMLNILERITSGEGEPGDIDKLMELADTITSGSLCGLGESAPNPVLSTIHYFRDEYETHIFHRRCPAGDCKSLVALHSLEDRCLPCFVKVAGYEAGGYITLKEVLPDAALARIIEKERTSGCIVDLVHFFMTGAQSESCGKCVPCRLGTTQMLGFLEDIASGRGSMAHLDLLVGIGNTVKMISQCPFGQNVSELLLGTLEDFRDEYEAHILEGGCPKGVCKVPTAYHTVCPIHLGVQLPEEAVLAEVSV
jgi:NADH:ubiquinone oxidoreductase subunit F (NADH-binding)/(2Fe-2S) ferredoxin